MVETEAVPVRTSTLVPFVTNAFDEAGKPTNPGVAASLPVMLDDLGWLAKALKTDGHAGSYGECRLEFLKTHQGRR